MNADLYALGAISDLTDNELGLFKNSLRILLAKTFIIRGNSGTGSRETELYDFTVRNRRIFEAWLSCMDAGIALDEGLGVIAFQCGGDMRLRLGKEETCALLVMRLLYEEKKLELSLAAFPSVSIAAFKHRYNAAVSGEIKKSRLAEVLLRLKSLKLIDLNSADVSDEEALIILYPSIALSVHRDSIDTLLASLNGKDEEAGENGESADPGQDGGGL